MFEFLESHFAGDVDIVGEHGLRRLVNIGFRKPFGRFEHPLTLLKRASSSDGRSLAGREGRPKTCHKADDLGPLKSGNEQARSVAYRQGLTTMRRNHAHQEHAERHGS